MSDEKQRDENEVDTNGSDIRFTGSQAEGDRETIEEDLAQKFEGRRPGLKPSGIGGDALSTPSKAEGDRDTIERDLDEKQK